MLRTLASGERVSAAKREAVDVHAKRFQLCLCVHDATVLHTYTGKAFARSGRINLVEPVCLDS